MREEDFKELFEKRITEMFAKNGKSEHAAQVGKTAAQMVQVIKDGDASGGSVVAALAVVAAFMIDTSSDKEASYGAFDDILKMFVSFDKPAFNKERGYEPLQ
jgi:hypothetical protein